VRVLVTGAGGQVGAEVVGFDHAGLDCGDRDAVEQVVGSVLPDAVVHCAAWTNVDGCESDGDRAWRDNGLAVRHVAVAAARVGAHVTHVSTDYVFDGELDRAYTEWDAVGPRSAYGRSKLAGEHELVQHASSWTLVRTSWVFGRRGGNFVDAILNRARQGEPLRVVDDQRGSPTYAPDLAAALVRLTVGRHVGTFHVTNQGVCTWHRFAEEIVAAAGLAERVGPIAAISSDELGRPAPRPVNSELANTALRLSGLPLLRDYHEALVDKIAAAGPAAAA